MGNYVFSAACLVRALREAHRRGETDFGGDVLPRLLHSLRMFAYDFTRNRVPGLNAYEEPAYWRDVGTSMPILRPIRTPSGASPASTSSTANGQSSPAAIKGPLPASLAGRSTTACWVRRP